MDKFSVYFMTALILVSTDALAIIAYRSTPEVLPYKVDSVDLRYRTFSSRLSFDENGAELPRNAEDSFSVADLDIVYGRGFYPQLEGTFLARIRNVQSKTETDSAKNSGLESLGLEAKYFLLTQAEIKNALRVHLKQTMYTNKRYDLQQTPPTEEVALGDDGTEMGIDYLFSFEKHRWKYNFLVGYNKPSGEMSGEVPYNAELVYTFDQLFLSAGAGGIYSSKSDEYTQTPALKGSIAQGNSRLFNSINRQHNHIYMGAQYTFSNFLVGIKAEKIFNGRSTDTGNALSLNLRWESKATTVSNNKATKSEIVPKFSEHYIAEGFVEKISKKGALVKINIGSNSGVQNGYFIDIFKIHNYLLGKPAASGVVIEVNPDRAFVKLQKRDENLTIEVGDLVKVHQ